MSKRENTGSVQPMLKMTVTGTVDYTAPEMINGRAGLASYGEAADVYSLAITFWDILNPGQDRYPQQRCNPMLIFETVVDGTRPDLDIPMHSRLRELIANAWQTDPSLRPTARHIVSQLESIQEELLATFASELCDDFDQSGLPHRPPSPCQERYFTGEYAIERMEDYKYIATTAEGIRLGNALMDAGFLHHLSHEQAFEDTDAMYFFDEDNVKFCQPFAILEANVTDSSCSSDDSCSSGSELQHFESFTASSGRKMSIGAGPKRILSQFTASLTSSGRSVSKISIFSSNSDTTSGSTNASNGECECSRLAQRLDHLGRHARRRRHRSHAPRRKCAPILEEDNPLELKLLDESDGEDGLATPSSSRERRSRTSSGTGGSGTGGSGDHRISITLAA